MTVKLLTEHHLEFLSLKGGCAGPSESTLVKMPHCWKSHVTAQLCCHNLWIFKRTVSVKPAVFSKLNIPRFSQIKTSGKFGQHLPYEPSHQDFSLFA